MLFVMLLCHENVATSTENNTGNGATQAASDSPGVPSAAVMVANGATIGKIILHIGDIFNLANPKERKYFYRLANRLHINTKEFVIRNNLLFKPGDRYSPQLLSESERILRAKNFLFDAEIRPVRYHDNKVDVEVETRDVWTLTGGVNYSHKGGESEYGFEIQENNFIGLGKSLKIKRDSNSLRTENEFKYHDPFIGRDRYQLTLGYNYNSDGHGKTFQVQRPFYSLETHWAMNLAASTNTQHSVVYRDGSIADHYIQDSERYVLSGGYSRGLVDKHTGRWELGYSVIKDRFSPNSATSDPLAIPDDRQLSYPWFNYSSIESRFIKTSRINLIGRTEDINLGNTYSVRLGWLRKDLKSDVNALIYNADFSTAKRNFTHNLILFNIGGSGRVGEGFTQNMTLGGGVRYFYPIFKNQVFYTDLQGAAGHNLDKDNQMLLGGDSGLRGYPSHVQNGNRRILFRMEQRYYTNLQILQLAYVAAAAFFDAGKAWTPGEYPQRYSGILKDVGLGLRLSPSRTSRGTVLHLDLAYALDSEEGTKKVQFLLTTEEQF
jgi:outer membrane protein assembly factor BamA